MSKVTAIPNAAPDINCVHERWDTLKTLKAKNEATKITATMVNCPASMPTLNAKSG